TGTSVEEARTAVAHAIPEVGRLLEDLAFLGAYRWMVDDGDGVVAWMGLTPRRGAAEAPVELAPGRLAIVDRRGAAVVSLWPFVQLARPTPDADVVPFFLDGRGRRGARLLALPGGFVREDEATWSAEV